MAVDVGMVALMAGMAAAGGVAVGSVLQRALGPSKTDGARSASSPRVTPRCETPTREAVDRGELALVYQPIVSLHPARAFHVEALVRWDHPTRGRIGPSAFIPEAERDGMIVPIGTWVLERACHEIADWWAAHPFGPALRVSVNLSPHQLADAGLPQMLARTMADSAVPAGSLCLEVTEGAVMDQPDAALRTLQQLRLLGAHIAIDDFGTGYSSLSYLKRLPVDWLKVDRSFVEGVDRDASDEAIVHAIVGMARSLDLTVVAEGVERAGQLAVLRSLGCDMAQGFYFSKPVTVEELRPVSSLAG